MTPSQYYPLSENIDNRPEMVQADGLEPPIKSRHSVTEWHVFKSLFYNKNTLANITEYP